MARVRSPNYPSLSLPAALERVRSLQKVEGQNAMPRDAIAKQLGFGSLNGASATMLSALNKYGLLEPIGDGEARVSDLSMRILFPDPDNPEEQQTALQDAALRPALFAEIREKWPERSPSDESLRSWLGRRGFAHSALKQVIQIYRDTVEAVGVSAPIQEAVSASTSRNSTIVAPETATPVRAEIPPPANTGGKPFTVGFDGTTLTGTIAIRSVRDIDRLVRVLQAQKAAFLAMNDEDEEDVDVAEEQLLSSSSRSSVFD